MGQTKFRYPIDQAIGKAIKELRRDAGYKMRELAEIANVQHTFFGKIENYQRRLTYGELTEVATWLGVDADDIIAKAKQIEQKDNHG